MRRCEPSGPGGALRPPFAMRAVGLLGTLLEASPPPAGDGLHCATRERWSSGDLRVRARTLQLRPPPAAVDLWRWHARFGLVRGQIIDEGRGRSVAVVQASAFHARISWANLAGRERDDLCKRVISLASVVCRGVRPGRAGGVKVSVTAGKQMDRLNELTGCEPGADGVRRVLPV